MPNTLLSPSVIAKEALMQLENNLVMGNLVHRDYKKEFVKVGDTVTIRRPVRFLANSGADITSQIQDATETSTSIKVDMRRNVAWKFSSQELTLNIQDYSERYIKPACIVLANQVDMALTGLYRDVFLSTGSPGSPPATFAALGACAQRLSEFAVPPSDRKLVLNPAGQWGLADGLKGIFNQQRVEGLIGQGFLGKVANFDIFEDQNVLVHTKGTANAAYVVNGASQVGSSITIGTGSGTFVVGDTVTFAGCNAVNPVSKQNLGYLMQFTVTAALGGPGNLQISPAITTSGPSQNVTASPTNGGAVVITANHTANIAFNKSAFALVCVDLEMPDSAVFKARESYKNLSIRLIKDYNVLLDEEIVRLDILFGVKTIYPDLACRLMG